MNSQKVVKNFMWRIMEKFTAQGVSLLISLVLARLIEPSAYGIVALITVLTSILDVFIDSGLGTALIQKKDADDLDFSSVFYFNIAMCLIIYVCIYMLSPAIARFYDIPELIVLTRILSLTLLISGVKNIQHAYISKHMMFKKFFFATLIGTVGSAIVGITMAYYGYGVWALVTQHLLNNLIDTIILWVTIKWRPIFKFSIIRLKTLFSYGWKILASSLLTRIYGNLRQILIGKIYSTEDLAFYNKGHEFPDKIIPSIEASINNILLPTVAEEQDDMGKALKITRRAVKVSAYVIWPMMIGLSVCGELIIELLLTERWVPAAPYLAVFCFEYAWWPISAIYNNAIKAIGRSDITLKNQVIVRISGLVILMFCVKQGVFAVAICAVAVTLLEFAIVSVTSQRILEYSFKDQCQDLFPSILLSLFMGVIVSLMSRYLWSGWILLLAQVFVGIVVYIAGSALLKLDSFIYLLNILNNILGRK